MGLATVLDTSSRKIFTVYSFSTMFYCYVSLEGLVSNFPTRETMSSLIAISFTFVDKTRSLVGIRRSDIMSPQTYSYNLE